MDTVRLPVQAVGHRRRRGLVEEAQYLESRQAGGVLGGLALGLVEIGGDRNDDPGKVATQGDLGALGQGPQDLGGDLHRADVPGAGADARHRRIGTHKLIRQAGAQATDLLDATPDETLGGGQGVEGVLGRRRLGGMAHDQALLGIAHHRGQQMASLPIGQGLGPAATHGSDQGVGRPQVDPGGKPVLVGSGGAARLRDLKQCHGFSRSGG